MNNNQLIIMYHSVSSVEIPEVIGSFPISFDRFKEQILLAKKLGYSFDFISNLDKNIESTNKIIYITGDDGTIDWTRNVLPWCEENKIPTHTGVITGPFHEKKVYPLTHLVQIILFTRDKNILEELSTKIKNNFLSKEQLSYINSIYHYEELEYRRIIKGAFNLILEIDIANELIGEYSSLERELLMNRFEQLDYYKQFKYAEIGVHSKSHCALGKNITSYIKDEIIESKELIVANELTLSGYFVSPMKPRYGATLDSIVTQLQELGFKGILDSNYGIWDKKNYIIPRIDAKLMEQSILL